jgi:hypothetical protein
MPGVEFFTLGKLKNEIKKGERGRRRGVKTRRFSDWLKEGRKEFPLSRLRIVA